MQMQLRENLGRLGFVTGFFYSMFLAFRIAGSALASAFYPAAGNTAGLVLSGVPADLAAALLFGLPTAFLLGRARWWRTGAACCLVQGAVLLAAFALGYLHVFEKPLAFSTLGAGLGSFWKEILHSALYEIPGGVLSMAVAGAALGAAFVFVIRRTSVRRTLAAVLLVLAPLLLPLVHEIPRVSGRAEAPVPEGLAAQPLFTVLAAVFGGGPSAAAAPSGALPASGGRFAAVSRLDERTFPRLALPRERPRHVVFYFFESTTASYIGMRHGDRPLTPHWERLARQALVFENHYANYPLSVNALFSVLTGFYNRPYKDWVVMSRPDLPLPTAPELLAAATGRKTAVFHTGDLDNFGYRRYFRKRGIDSMLDMKDFAKRGYRRSTPHSVDDRALIAPTIDFLRQSGERGACVVLLPVLPHHPYTIPEDEFGLSFRLPDPPADSRGRTFHRYKESLAYADGVLGALAEALEAAALADDTLLVVFADHGEAFYQHPGNYLHALFVYEENVRVPFLVHNPRLFPETRRYPGVSSHVDILPTVLELLGGAEAPEGDGISLVGAHRARLAFLHTDWEDERIGIRDGRFKYIRETAGRREELYDLESDPRERTNLAAGAAAARHAAVLGPLREAAGAGRRGMEAPLPAR